MNKATVDVEKAYRRGFHQSAAVILRTIEEERIPMPQSFSERLYAHVDSLRSWRNGPCASVVRPPEALFLSKKTTKEKTT